MYDSKSRGPTSIDENFSLPYYFSIVRKNPSASIQLRNNRSYIFYCTLPIITKSFPKAWNRDHFLIAYIQHCL